MEHQRLNAAVLGLLMILWGGWGVFQNGLVLVRAGTTDMDAVQAKVDQTINEEQVLRDLERRPEWQRLSVQARDLARERASQLAPIGAAFFGGAVMTAARLGQPFALVEFSLSVMWLVVGVYLAQGMSGSGVWVPWVAGLTILWELIGPFLIQGLAERRLLGEYAVQMAQWEAQSAHTQVIPWVSMINGLMAGGGAVLNAVRRIFIPCLWSSFALWYWSRNLTKAQTSNGTTL